MSPPAAADARILVDHIILVTGDADATCQELLERTGLRAVPGGTHEGSGTCNRIVPLGSAYAEIVDVHDPNLAATNGFGQLGLAGLEAARRRGRTDSLIGWATRVDDPAGVVERAGGEVQELRRVGVSVQLGGAALSASTPGRPFFLRRGEREAFPGRLPAEHLVRVDGIVRLNISGQGEDTTWLTEVPGGSTLLTLTDGEPALVEVVIGVIDGAPIVLRAAEPTGTAQ